jgi:hypothetical protein
MENSGKTLEEELSIWRLGKEEGAIKIVEKRGVEV